MYGSMLFMYEISIESKDRLTDSVVKKYQKPDHQ